MEALLVQLPRCPHELVLRQAEAQNRGFHLGGGRDPILGLVPVAGAEPGLEPVFSLGGVVVPSVLHIVPIPAVSEGPRTFQT